MADATKAASHVEESRGVIFEFLSNFSLSCLPYGTLRGSVLKWHEALQMIPLVQIEKLLFRPRSIVGAPRNYEKDSLSIHYKRSRRKERRRELVLLSSVHKMANNDRLL